LNKSLLFGSSYFELFNLYFVSVSMFHVLGCGSGCYFNSYVKGYIVGTRKIHTIPLRFW